MKILSALKKNRNKGAEVLELGIAIALIAALAFASMSAIGKDVRKSYKQVDRAFKRALK